LLAFHRSIRFQISHPHHYTITFIRCAGQSLPFNQQTPRLTVTEPIILQPDMFSLKAGTDIELTLGIQQSDSRVITRLRSSVKVPIIGVALLDKDGWTALDANQPLNTE